jgi:hypothetical protein
MMVLGACILLVIVTVPFVKPKGEKEEETTTMERLFYR